MNNIIVLWATPRSTSTAFEWMMRMRGDLVCFHEPFGEPWHYGENPLWPRWTAETKTIPGLTYQSVLEKLLNAAKTRPVFSKDMAHFTSHMWDGDFLSHFQHTFLIRHPHKSVSSVYRNGPEFELAEIGIDVQRSLFDLVWQKYGTLPTIIDSDDLLENPGPMVEAYCGKIGIPYIEEALSWQPGSRNEVSWYDQGSWHDALKNSDGLKPQKTRSVDISDAPKRVKDFCEIFLPHYKYMHQYRLKH